jgi:hypothetical protein
MSSDRDVLSERSDRLRVDAGTQVLASFSSMQSPLTELPPGAYQNLLVVSTKSPETVERRLGELGVPLSNVGLVPLAGSEYDYDGPLWTTDPVKPNDPTGLSIAYSDAATHLIPGVGHLLVGNLNVMAMYVREETVCRVLSHLAGKARQRSITGIYGVVETALSEASFRNFRKAVDVEIDCRR